MNASLAEPVAKLHHFIISGIHIRAAVGKQILAIKPKFKSSVIGLTVPFALRTCFHHHYCSILFPPVSESEKARSQSTMRQIRQRSAFTSFGCIIAYPFTIRENIEPLLIIFNFCRTITQFGIAETRIAIIREANI